MVVAIVLTYAFVLIFTRLCQVLNLNPTYILIAEVIFSNIGGAATGWFMRIVERANSL